MNHTRTFSIILSTILLYPIFFNVNAEDGQDNKVKLATFAGGCFWCMEPPFDKLDGVVSTTSGYSGGRTQDPSYSEVSSGLTGHIEVIQIAYNPDKVSFEELLAVYWVNIDPTNQNGQFCDRGNQYRSALFYHDEDQKRLIEESRRGLDETKPFKQAIVTEIIPFEQFYAAEDYHQDYYQKNPLRYKYYYYACGREKRLKELWGEKKA